MKTVRLHFKMILRRRLTVSDFEVNVGTISNFIANDHTYEYTIDVTAPETGAGVMVVSAEPFANVYENIIYAPQPTEDIVLASQLKRTHLNNPESDTLYTREVTEDDLDDINDFQVLIGFDQNVSGLTEDKVVVRAVDDMGEAQDISIQHFEGKNSVYALTVRPPAVAGNGQILIAVPKNATNEGNPEKALTIPYSDEIIEPEWEELFETVETYNDIVSVSPEGIQLLRSERNRESEINFFDFQGNINADKQITISTLSNSRSLMRIVRYDVDKYWTLDSVMQPMPPHISLLRGWRLGHPLAF